jgi:cytochrome c-type biogenesis protein CcmH
MTAERGRVHFAVRVGVLAIAGTAAGMYAAISLRAPLSAPATGEPAVAQPLQGVSALPAQRPSAPAIEVSAEKLAIRLANKDGSADDWALLARSYIQLQRYPEAVAAFGRALEKAPGNAAFVAEQSAARKAIADGAAVR